MSKKTMQPSKIVRVWADGRVTEEPYEGWAGGRYEVKPDPGRVHPVLCASCGHVKEMKGGELYFRTDQATDHNTEIEGGQSPGANGPPNGGVIVLIQHRTLA